MSIQEKYDSMEYGPAPENQNAAVAWLDAHDRKFNHFIDGAWIAPSAKDWFESRNPASGEVLAQIAQGSKTDVDTAVAAAGKAAKSWAKLSGHARARHLYALALSLIHI